MTKKTINPFSFENTEVNSNSSNRLEWTPALVDKGNSRAIELMKTVAEKPDLHDLANRVLDVGNTLDLIELIESVFDADTIVSDASILDGATEDELSRLLESRRSDRSKAKAKGPRKSVSIAQTFIGSMYSEMLVRIALKKPYQAQSTEVNIDELKEDTEALNKKIKSLQSKKCRLKKTAEFIEADAKALEEVEAEIERLSALRPTSGKVSTKTIIKNADVDSIREALNLINVDELDADKQEQILKLMAQLG